jgi:hypothetical protein
MPQKMLSPSFTLISFIPVVFSAPIVVVAFQAIVGTRPKECSESPKKPALAVSAIGASSLQGTCTNNLNNYTYQHKKKARLASIMG